MFQIQILCHYVVCVIYLVYTYWILKGLSNPSTFTIFVHQKANGREIQIIFVQEEFKSIYKEKFFCYGLRS